MKSINQIMKFGGKAAAQQMYKDGQGFESNPFQKGSKDSQEFSAELTRLWWVEEFGDSK